MSFYSLLNGKEQSQTYVNCVCNCQGLQNFVFIGSQANLDLIYIVTHVIH